MITVCEALKDELVALGADAASDRAAQRREPDALPSTSDRPAPRWAWRRRASKQKLTTTLDDSLPARYELVNPWESDKDGKSGARRGGQTPTQVTNPS